MKAGKSLQPPKDKRKAETLQYILDILGRFCYMAGISSTYGESLHGAPHQCRHFGIKFPIRNQILHSESIVPVVIIHFVV